MNARKTEQFESDREDDGADAPIDEGDASGSDDADSEYGAVHDDRARNDHWGYKLGVWVRSMRLVVVALVVLPFVSWRWQQASLEVSASSLGFFWLVCLGVALDAATRPSINRKSSIELIELLRAKRVLPGILLALLLVCEGIALKDGWRHAALKKEALAVTAIPDACERAAAWEKLGGEAADTLNAGEAGPAVGAGALCDSMKAAAAKKAYLEACSKVGEHLAAGTLADGDREVILREPLGDKAGYASGQAAVGLAERIASRSLVTADLRAISKLPCGSVSKDGFLAAARVSADAWGGMTSAEDAPQELVAALTSASPGDGRLAPKAMAALHQAAETTAGAKKTPTTVVDAAQASGASKLCMLETKLGGTVSEACSRLVQAVMRVEAREAAEAKRIADEAEAKEKRRQAIEEAKAKAEEAAERRRVAVESARGAVGGAADSELRMSCIRSCNLSRSAGAQQADESSARECLDTCGNDGACLMRCRASQGGGSADACIARCVQQYPAGLGL